MSSSSPTTLIDCYLHPQFLFALISCFLSSSIPLILSFLLLSPFAGALLDSSNFSLRCRQPSLAAFRPATMGWVGIENSSFLPSSMLVFFGMDIRGRA